MTDAEAQAFGLVKVGEASPFASQHRLGDVWVSQAAIAQLGMDEVRRQVRRLYEGPRRALAAQEGDK